MSKARELADLGSVTTRLDEVGNTDGALSNRNILINGAMQVAQRGTSFTAPASNSYTLDRFAMYATSTFLNVAQDADAPDGFRNSLKTTVNTANPTPSSTDLCRIAYVVEAQDVARLNYGSASAQTTTLSFWVKSTVAADYTVFVYVDDPARSIVKDYTINTANTWEYKTITIAGDTGGSGISDDSGVGLYLEFNLMAGSTYNTAGAQDTWVAGGGTRASGQTANCTTSGATWQITGVQLEIGDQSTPFEHRSYGQELALCQRFFQGGDKNHGKTQCHAGPVGHLAYRHFVMSGGHFSVVMRTAPTITAWSNQTNSQGYVSGYSSGINRPINGGPFANEKGLTGYVQTATSATSNEPQVFFWSADAEL